MELMQRSNQENKIQTYFKVKQQYSYSFDRKFGLYLSLDFAANPKV